MGIIEKKKLTKYMSREHSFFYAHVWNEANRDTFDKFIFGINVKNMIFLMNKLGVLEVYYDLEELEEIFERIAEEVTKDSGLLDKTISEFDFYLEKLLPYLKNEKKIESLDELREYYENWARWWSPMAIIFVIPNNGRIPKNLRDRAFGIRAKTEKYSDDGDRVFLDFVKEKYGKFSDLANFMTPDEVYGIESLSELQVEEIRKRKEGYALATFSGKSRYVSLDELKSEAEKNDLRIEELKEECVVEIAGSVAYPGKICGRVRLILTKKDLDGVKNRDILVTYSTSPDYVPAMKKAAAIVTDEGGVTCHAAIVSRELGIPCVVGTKIGTGILKNGDFIEVNADEGIIRILERNPPRVEKKVLSELLHADWPIAVAQLANYGETIKDIEWSEEKFECFPYNAFERKNGSVYFYLDKNGIEWKKEQAAKFDKEKAMKIVSDSYDNFKDVILKERAG